VLDGKKKKEKKQRRETPEVEGREKLSSPNLGRESARPNLNEGRKDVPRHPARVEERLREKCGCSSLP